MPTPHRDDEPRADGLSIHAECGTIPEVGKYVTDIPSTNPERAVERIEDYLAGQGFYQVGRSGKEVWKRTSKTLYSPEFLFVSAGDGHVHLEAWIKAVTPLPGLWVGNANPHKGAPIGVPSKERLRERLEHIERIVR
jgi:hypothetical protein